MKEYTPREFAQAVPCSRDTLRVWRNNNILKPAIYDVTRVGNRGFYRYTEEQLPKARVLLETRASKKLTPWQSVRNLFVGMSDFDFGYASRNLSMHRLCTLIIKMIDQIDKNEAQDFYSASVSLDNDDEMGHAKAISTVVVNMIYARRLSNVCSLNVGVTHDLHSIGYNRIGLTLVIEFFLTKASETTWLIERYLKGTGRTPKDYVIPLPAPSSESPATTSAHPSVKGDIETDTTAIKADISAQEPTDALQTAEPILDITTAQNAQHAAQSPSPEDSKGEMEMTELNETKTNLLNIKENNTDTSREDSAPAEHPAPMDAEPDIAIRDTIADVEDTPRSVDISDPLLSKKNTPATDASNKNTVQNTHKHDSTNPALLQHLQNLPQEILDQPRFFPVNENKAPLFNAWSNPDNQTRFSKVKGLAGFDTCGHGQAPDYLFLDFDHVLTDDGHFVNREAKRWFNFIVSSFEDCYIERSISGHGIHILAKPTPEKFMKINNTDGEGVLHFDADNPKIKLEIFYKQAARYCLVTGNFFQSESKKIPAGVVVDDVLETLLRVIADTATGRKTPVSKSDFARERKFTPEIQALIDEINSTDAAELELRGYLEHSEKGAPYPYGYICPWCGSGTHEHRTGALQFYNETANNHVHCHARQCHGDIIDLFAQVNGYSTQGKEFFNVLKAFADEFHIDYDPKIFEHQPASTKDDDAPRTKDFIKDCPVNLRLPRGFEFDARGIRQIIPPRVGKDEPPKVKNVTCTPIIPTKKFREPVKGTMEYEFAILSDGMWTKTEIDGRDLTDLRELPRILAGHGALIDEPKLLVRFINAVISMNHDLPKLKSYNKTGWTTEDCEDFAYPSINGNAVVRRVGYDYERIFRAKGDPDAWKKKFCEITEQGGAVARIVIGAAAAASLVKPLQLPNLQVHINGARSIGKTPLLQFAVSIHGNPTFGALTHTFAATPKNRLDKATAFSDLPLIFDELESISKRDAEKLPEDIYNYYLGVGRQAQTKDGTARETKVFSGARLTSGEHSLVQSFGNAGEFKRVLDLHCSKLLEEDFASDLYGFCANNYGLFGEQWIKYILKHRDFISKNYHQTLDTVKTVQKINGEENDLTQLRMLVISAVAYQHFKICIGLSNLATNAAVMNNDIATDIDDIIRTLPTAAEIDDTARAIAFLQSFTAGNDKFFMHEVDKPEFDDEFTQTATECYGKIFKNGEVAFLPHALKKILEGVGGFKSADKLINEFHDKGYLRHTNGLNTYQTKINGKNTRAIRFNTCVLLKPETDSKADTADA